MIQTLCLSSGSIVINLIVKFSHSLNIMMMETATYILYGKTGSHCESFELILKKQTRLQRISGPANNMRL
jgi:hypothetical protein